MPPKMPNAGEGGAMLIKADQANWREEVEGATFWELALEGVSLTFFTLADGTAFPPHSHASEQITLVLEGTLAFDLATTTLEVGPGDAIALPSNVTHGVRAIGEVEAVDAWSPPPDHLGGRHTGTEIGSGSDLLRRSFDEVSELYAEVFREELEAKPYDRQVLTRFASSFDVTSRVLDVGCGPGHVSRFLADLGVPVAGVDFSEEMISVARSRHPGIEFTRADMRALPEPDHSVDGILAFYSIIYLDDAATKRALAEMRRVLRPGGQLLAAIHVGTGTELITEFHGKAVSVEIVMRPLARFVTLAAAAGFELISAEMREPYPQEHPTQRGYLVLRTEA